VAKGDDVELRDDDARLRRVVTELMAADLARYHRDNLLCAETVFIIQEARVQMLELGECKSHYPAWYILIVCSIDVCCRSSACHTIAIGQSSPTYTRIILTN
jgi:hypothetical protein